MKFSLTKLSFKNKVFINFILVVFVLLGIIAFNKMSKLEDPEVPVREAVIMTVYPGASAEKVEQEVTIPLERAIRSMGHIYEMTSRSMPNASQINISLETTLPKSKFEEMWNILRKKVSDAREDLPEGAMAPQVHDDFGEVYGMFYALQSDGYSQEEMYDQAKKIKQQLLDIDGVKRVEIYGRRRAVINIGISQEKLARLGVHPLEIIATVKGQNQSVYPGALKSGPDELNISVNDDYKSIDDIRNLVIQGHENDQFKLGDIATVTRGYEDPQMMTMRYNKMPAIGISVAMKDGENILKLGDEVTQTLNKIQKKLPVGMTINKVFYQPEKVKKAIDSFAKNLIEAVLIVIVVLMLVMGLRSGIIIAVNLICIITATIAVLWFMDGTLQRVSLAAFIIAMGMLVDNAIVVLDIILLDLQRGVHRMAAFAHSPQKVAIPLLAATMIAIIAFLPIDLSPDETGDYVGDLFIVLAVSLLISWILSMTHIPLMASRYLKLSPKLANKKPLQGPFYNFFRRVLNYCFQRRTATIGVMVLLLLISAWGYRFVKQSFFPDLSYNQFYIEYSMPSGKNTDAVEADSKKIENWLLKNPDITAVTTSLSSTPSRYCLVRSIADPGMNYAELIVTFKDYNTLKKEQPSIQAYLNSHYPESYIRVRRYNLIGFTSHLVEVMFRGPDPNVLKNLSGQAQTIFEQEPKAALVENDWYPKTKNIIVDYNQPLARQSGLSRMDVSNSLLAATDGIPIGSFYENDEQVPLILKTTDSKGNKISNLEDIPIWGLLPNIGTEQIKGTMEKALLTKEIDLSPFMKSTPLSQTTKGINVEWKEPLIRHFNGEREITVKCDMKPGYSADEVRQSMKSKIEAIHLPDGYTMTWRGEYYNQNKAMKYILFYLPLAIMLMIGILIALFHDLKKPAIIILSIPFAAIGIVWGMVIASKAMGFVSIVGAIGLMGMMIRNGVVLIEEIEKQTKRLDHPIDAIKLAALTRLRPVSMQSLSCILGMIPLISDDLFGSLAVTMMGGLLIGTIITLVFIPILYSVFFKVKIHKSNEVKTIEQQ